MNLLYLLHLQYFMIYQLLVIELLKRLILIGKLCLISIIHSYSFFLKKFHRGSDVISMIED